LEFAAEKEISVHIVKNRMVMDDSLPSRITAKVLGLAAEIEREFISAGTVEILARRKAQGLPLGRPKGAKAKKVKLDEYRETIISYLRRGSANFPSPRSLNARPRLFMRGIDRNRLESYVRRKGQNP
jgi:DNA invertase Pin-like site-specific DNA recombinase